MDSLDLIEKRIDALSLLLGPLPDAEVKGSENFVNSLISANTLISSAMSGRENIAKVFNRSEELEQYLDPNYIEECQEAKAKEVYVNTVAPELAANFECLEKIKALESTLGAEYFRNIPDVGDKLKDVNEIASELNQKNELIEESLIIAMHRYGEIQNGITESLKAMNERLDRLEDKLQQKNNL